MKQLLFIGNSFTYFNDLPHLVKMIADNAGWEVECTPVVKGGWYLNRYANPEDEMGKVLREVYPTKKWDYIILQDQSFNPAGDPADFLQAVKDLKQLMDCKAKFVMYQTWAYEDGSEKLAGKGMTYDEMYNALRASYQAGAKEIGAVCSPVGDAFWLCCRAWPGIKLYNAEDHFHPSLYGSYLGACVFYGAMSGNKLEKLWKPDEMDENTAEKLQRIAIESLKMNGLYQGE